MNLFYAAFHDEGDHPHIHMMAWSVKPGQAYLSKDGIRKIKSELTNDIFRQEMNCLYEQKSESRDELVRQARREMKKLTREMRQSICSYPKVENLMVELSQKLETVKGKKSYGYLPKSLKPLVDRIVDELEQMPVISECYETWWGLQCQVNDFYSNDIEVRDPERGVQWLECAVRNGSDYAAYRLGKEYLRGRVIGKDIPKAVEWFARAAESGNPHAQYMLGKLYLAGGDIPQDKEQAVYWLNESASQGNVYAQHLLDHPDRPTSGLLSVTRLLYHIGNIFRDNAPSRPGPGSMFVDQKLRLKMKDKRIAMGHKPDDHAEYQGPMMSM